MNIKKLLVVGFVLITNMLFAQKYAGIIINKNTGKPIEYVNIGVLGKNIGTVSDMNGNYSLTIDPQFDNEVLRISCIGYYPVSLKVSDFKSLKSANIYLEVKIFEIPEVVIRPRIYKQQTLGVTTKAHIAAAGFKDNNLGYECGIIMKIKKSAIIEKVNINFASCSYDTILYRLNIYKVKGEIEFENILQKPIYIKLPKAKTKETVIIDLLQYNMIVQGDILVTLEHVKDLGPGNLYFCAGMSGKTYYRKTSQGIWETAPVGVSISVDAKVEK